MSVDTTCPSCGHSMSAQPAEPVSCAECGHWFVPAGGDHDGAARLGPYELEVQRSPGDAIRGPFDRVDLRERLYLGLYTGDELIRPVGGRFSTMRSHPDFAAILQLKDRGRPGPVIVRRAAPKAVEPSAAEAPAEASPSPAADSLRAAAESEVAKTDPKRAMLIAVGTLLLGALVLGFGFLALSLSM